MKHVKDVNKLVMDMLCTHKHTHSDDHIDTLIAHLSALIFIPAFEQ